MTHEPATLFTVRPPGYSKSFQALPVHFTYAFPAGIKVDKDALHAVCSGLTFFLHPDILSSSSRNGAVGGYNNFFMARWCKVLLYYPFSSNACFSLHFVSAHTVLNGDRTKTSRSIANMSHAGPGGGQVGENKQRKGLWGPNWDFT